jgi:hypothetical protein
MAQAPMTTMPATPNGTWYHYQGAGSFEGTSFTDDQRCVMVWEKQAGAWRLVMEQCSFNSK